MRVHALAKEYGIKSTEFVDIVQSFGISISSHLSGLDDAQIADIRYKMSIKDQAEQGASEELPPEVKEWIPPTKEEDGEESTVVEILGETPPDETVVHEDEFKITQEDIEEAQADIGDSYTEEVSPYQQVEVETPKGFWGWLRSLFS